MAHRSREHEGAYVASVQQMIEYGHLASVTGDDDDAGDDREVRGTRIVALSSLAIHSLLGLTVAAAVWSGVEHVRAGSLDPGELFLFVAYALMVHRRLAHGGQQLTKVGKVKANLQRLAPLIADRANSAAQALTLRRALVLDDVRVEPVRGRRPRVDTLNLRIDAGSKVAVVGHVGDGKTSLLRCVAGLESLASGRVLWDDAQMRPLDELLLSGVAWLPQDPVFTNASAWRVLGLPSPDQPSEAQREALRRVGAWDLLERFPKGLRQKVGSGSVSRNEGRTLCLGAVALGNAPLWVLDSPLEGLRKKDALGRLKGILDCAEGRTVVLSLAQLYDPERFDRVLVLHRGSVRFDGTPAQWQLWKENRKQEVAKCKA
jgi:ABC-type transport system involved in cytochrome bd biosynthesis fused ATPase/permease subunit